MINGDAGGGAGNHFFTPVGRGHGLMHHFTGVVVAQSVTWEVGG